jgi:hypothetical protein
VVVKLQHLDLNYVFLVAAKTEQYKKYDKLMLGKAIAA